MYGSFVTVINGDSSQIRVSATSSLISLQQQMKLNAQGKYVKRFNGTLFTRKCYFG